MLFQFDWIGSLHLGRGGVMVGTPYNSWDVELHNVALVLRLEQHEPELDQTRSIRNSLFISTCNYTVYSVYIVRTFSGELTCSKLPGLCDSLPETQGMAFLFMYHNKMWAWSHTHGLVYTVCPVHLCMKVVWHLHKWGLYKDLRFPPSSPFCLEMQWGFFCSRCQAVI